MTDSKKSDDVILPLKLEKERKLSKDQMVTFKLRTDPTQATSTTFELSVPFIDGSEGPRAAILAQKHLTRVITGMNITTAQGCRAMVHTIYRGEAKAAYDRQVNTQNEIEWELARETARQQHVAANPGATDAQIAAVGQAVGRPDISDACHTQGMSAIVKYMCPYKVLERVKRQLRRNCRKPADMTMVEFFTAVNRINTEEIPYLPPFNGANQSLTEEEIKEILHYGLPNSWKNEMTRQGFDLINENTASLLEFCQRLEEIPDFQAAKRSDNQSSKKKSGSSNVSKQTGKSNSGTSGGNSKFCLLHGTGSHTTDMCNTLKAQIKRQKGSNEIKKESSNNFGNKTWSRKADIANKNQKKELATFIKNAVKGELNAISTMKKRKGHSKADGFAIDPVEEILEEGQIDLSEFNYEDMDDLKIETDDEDFEDAKSSMDEDDA